MPTRELPQEHQEMLKRAAEAEELAQTIIELKNQLVDLDRRRQSNMEALACYRTRNAKFDEQVDKQWLCAGKIFFRLPATHAKSILIRDKDVIQEEYNSTREQIKENLKIIHTYRPSDLDSPSVKLVLQQANEIAAKGGE